MSTGKCKRTCANYAPLPPNTPKEKLPLIKVEAWWGETPPCSNICKVKRSEYTFHGQPNWSRIIRETFGEGAEVVRVTPVKGTFKNFIGAAHSQSTWPFCICKYETAWCDKAGRDSFDKLWWRVWTHPSDADIESAIREHHKADGRRTIADEIGAAVKEYWEHHVADAITYHVIPIVSDTGRERIDVAAVAAPKSAHKKGERFEGKHVYTGVLRVPRSGDSYEAMDGLLSHYSDSSDNGGVVMTHNGGMREILTLVPDAPEPRYKVGQWIVVDDTWTVEIIKSHNNTAYDYTTRRQDGVKIYLTEKAHSIRPAVPADFERVVGNLRGIAYRFQSDAYVQVKWSDGSDVLVTCAVCAALGFTPVPLSVSGGKFEAPPSVSGGNEVTYG